MTAPDAPRDHAAEALVERKQMVRDLGDMACIGCRANTCPACKLAAEITNQLYLAEALRAEEYAAVEAERDALPTRRKPMTNSEARKRAQAREVRRDRTDATRRELVEVVARLKAESYARGRRDALAEVRAIDTHNGMPVTPESLNYAATHEALCRSWIFDVLTGLADTLRAEIADPEERK